MKMNYKIISKLLSGMLLMCPIVMDGTDNTSSPITKIENIDNQGAQVANPMQSVTKDQIEKAKKEIDGIVEQFERQVVDSIAKQLEPKSFEEIGQFFKAGHGFGDAKEQFKRDDPQRGQNIKNATAALDNLMKSFPANVQTVMREYAEGMKEFYILADMINFYKSPSWKALPDYEVAGVELKVLIPAHSEIYSGVVKLVFDLKNLMFGIMQNFVDSKKPNETLASETITRLNQYLSDAITHKLFPEIQSPIVELLIKKAIEHVEQMSKAGKSQLQSTE